ncbi:MAG: BlaI/MecI/CopY family transcriptional regulator [Nitriliruptoraceae bacterium]
MPDGHGVSAERLLGTLEYEVMRALWQTAPASVHAVREQVNRRRSGDAQLAYTTVMTVLARLHDKGVVDRERRGRGYDYTPAFDEAQLVEHLGRREVSELLDRYGEVALAQFAAALEQADPQLLRRLRDSAEAGDA